MSKRKAFELRTVTKEEVPEEEIKTWGGKRPGAGHPKNPYPLRAVTISCTEEEYQQILKLSTRERTVVLLEGVKK